MSRRTNGHKRSAIHQLLDQIIHPPTQQAIFSIYRVRINYRSISLRHTLGRKCRKIVKFVSITHSERNVWKGPVVPTAISREKRKPVLEENGYLTDRA